ncbi:hypothetical protein Y032_0746g2016 [Ancylostoma ceylanicum]|uniref:Uncharacterized protein n=1 Tax=Ancylostoma ceylanicum TaxID=53326 RepID=A0A016WFM2_9BILA|nr:hypothetical protein Y032_0746g2016 [Ancylostoma ceylanicum]
MVRTRSGVVVFPAASCADALRWRSAWVMFMEAVVQGPELIALPGPQDDDTWGRTIDMIGSDGRKDNAATITNSSYEMSTPAEIGEQYY